MMAVMMLGMPPVNGYHIDIRPGEQGARGRAESMFSPPAWFENSRAILATEKGANPTAPHGARLWSQEGFLPSGSCSKPSWGWEICHR
jgi:hypothetical protein